MRHTKFLCVIFDDNLEWSNHISYINTKITKRIGIICRGIFLNTTALMNLYHEFIFPYIIYCVEVWGNALSKHVQPLIKLQDKIFKIITPSHIFINKYIYMLCVCLWICMFVHICGPKCTYVNVVDIFIMCMHLACMYSYLDKIHCISFLGYSLISLL